MISIDIEKQLNAQQNRQLLKLKKSFAGGSITRISGPSGAGKSTLLSIIAGFINPGSGIIKVDNTIWVDTSAKISLTPQRRGVGFVFQDYALFPNMNVQQHLEYATGDKAWIKKLLLFGQMETFVKHKPAYLSGGQQQRLAILRALANKPKILLMDEPFSALDYEIKEKMIKGLKIILDELGTTSLIVTHNPMELDGIANNAIYL